MAGRRRGLSCDERKINFVDLLFLKENPTQLRDVFGFCREQHPRGVLVEAVHKPDRPGRRVKASGVQIITPFERATGCAGRGLPMGKWIGMGENALGLVDGNQPRVLVEDGMAGGQFRIASCGLRNGENGIRILKIGVCCWEIVHCVRLRYWNGAGKTRRILESLMDIPKRRMMPGIPNRLLPALTCLARLRISFGSHETHVSTIQACAQAPPRISQQDPHQGRTGHTRPSPQEGSQTFNTEDVTNFQCTAIRDDERVST